MYECPYCPQRFDTPDDRDDHVVAGHRDAPIFEPFSFRGVSHGLGNAVDTSVFTRRAA